MSTILKKRIYDPSEIMDMIQRDFEVMVNNVTWRVEREIQAKLPSTQSSPAACWSVDIVCQLSWKESDSSYVHMCVCKFLYICLHLTPKVDGSSILAIFSCMWCLSSGYASCFFVS